MPWRPETDQLLLTALVMGLTGVLVGAETSDLRLRLALHEALPQRGEQHPGAPSVIVSLRRDAGVWERVWATAGDFNRKDHSGRVDSAEWGDDRAQLRLTLNVQGDPWVPGGRLVVAAEIEKQSDGSWRGAYRGTFRGGQVRGRANAVSLPPSESYAEPAGPTEHPRLLFRASDLPALRERAKTTLGQLALAKMTDSAAGSAFRYALTGDASLADDARRRIEALMPDREDGSKLVRSRWWAWRIEQAAIAYDLCYHAWDTGFRQEVADYLDEAANVILYNRGVLDNHINWDYGGAHAPTMLWAAGVAGLAIAGERGPEPIRPPPPHCIGPAKGHVEPASGLEPDASVPRVRFTSDVMPVDWLYAGPFPEDSDPLDTHERRGAARPHPGLRLGAGESAATWRKVEPGEGIYNGPYSDGRTILELTGPSGVATHTQSYYYTVLENERELWARVSTKNAAVEVYLSGEHLVDGDVVHLEPGLYPWLITGPIGEMNPWGKTFAEPTLIEMDEAALRRAVADAESRHASQLADWRQDHDQWVRTKGSDVRYLKTYEAARHVMDMVFAELLGRGGFLSGAGNLQAMSGPNKYAFQYRQVTGRDPGGFAEIRDYLPRSMFVHPYRPDGRLIGQEVNGLPGFVCSDYPERGRDASTELFATLLPLVREYWRPVMLWAWQYHTGGSTANEEAILRILTARRGGYEFRRPYGSFDTHPIYAFLNYPQGMRPAAPEGILPLTWQAPDFGFYGFRNEWTGRDSQFIVQLFSSTYGEGAGTLRVAGLGHVWSHGLGAPAERRYGENVVQLPEDEINAGARGRVTRLETLPDGSGGITVDLSDVYSAPVHDEKGSAMALYERYGSVRRPVAFGDGGIRGMRCLAVDFSGKSGAPCLIVIVDRIHGGGTKSWTWQLESKSESAGKSAKHPTKEGWIVFRGREFDSPRNGQLLFSESKAIEGDDRVKLQNTGFSLTRGDATLHATVVTPERPEMEFAEKAQYVDMPKGGVQRNSSKAIFATGGDEFFVVLTFQRGEGPMVTIVRGEGLDASVRVGGQTVRFDGEKILFGD